MNDIEYELEYKNYYAEKEYYDNLYKIGINTSLNESYITEDANTNIKQSILKYTEKIIENIQKAWDKFKEAVVPKTWEQIKSKYAKQLTMDRPLTITDVTDNDVFPKIKEVEDFINSTNGAIGIEELNSSYEDTSEFMTKISNDTRKFVGDKFDKRSMKAEIDKNCFEKMKSGEEIGLDKIQAHSAFLDKYKENVDKIQKDIDNINNASKTIKNAIDNLRIEAPTSNNQQQGEGNQQANSEAYAMISAITGNDLLLEFNAVDSADPDGNKSSGNKSPNAILQKHVSDYFKICSSILTLKMQTLNKAQKKCMSITLKYCRNAAGYDNGTNLETNETNSGTKNVPQIDK